MSTPSATALACEAQRYRVTHDTHYAYALPVSLSQQLLHLAPRAHPRQQVLDWQLDCSPAPTRERVGLDPFGNPVSRIEFDFPHDELSVRAITEVIVSARAEAFNGEDSPPWEAVRDAFRYRSGQVPDADLLAASCYRLPSPFVPVGAAFADFAADCFIAKRPMLAACAALMQKIFREFRFDATATQIATPLAEVLALRRGVCQDFAHLLIACLRTLGLPARYVSGYLLTTPPPGRPRMIGADASHAWVAVRCPRQGWVEFDPTNNVLPELQHIVLGWGRDFGDVSPLRGVILGGGAHSPKVAVTVEPVAMASLHGSTSNATRA